MLCGPDLEHENQLMLRPIETPHAAIGLVPDAKVLQFGKNLFAGIQQFAHMAPIHENECDCTVPAACCP
jgi:hypothetical protein